MTRVASVCGPDFATVLFQPYELTLLAFLGVLERERIHGLKLEQQLDRLAYLVNWALCDVDTLNAEHRELQGRLMAQPQDATFTKADLIAAAEALFHQFDDQFGSLTNS